MTEKINFGRGVGPVEALNKGRRVKTSQNDESKSASDRVDFSSVLQEATKTKDATPVADQARAEKIQALKAQIESGNYQPDLEKVAESLLKFIVEG